MFFRKITTRTNGKEYTYVKLIENYRKGNKVKQRVIANLGNVEDLDPPKVQNLIVSLSRVCGVEVPIKAKPKAKRILRFGDVLLIHKVWDKLGLNQAICNCKNTTPDMALASELLTINQFLNLPPGALSEWRRHIYLPVHGQNRLDFEEALALLAEIKDTLETHLLNRLKEWGKISQIYCYMMKGFFEKTNTATHHFLSQPPERKPFQMDIFATKEGIPVGYKLFLNIAKRISQAQEQYKKCTFVGNALNLNGHNEQEYITGLFVSPEIARQFHLNEELTESPDTFYQLHEDLWYKEIRRDDVRYLLCFNPLLAARKQEMENELKEALEKEAASYGKFLIITNSQTLSCEELINVYNNFVTFKKRYRTIKCSSLTRETEMKGQVFICFLAHTIEKILEHILHQQEININAATALQILEPVKITINEVAGEIIPSTITMDKTQRKILSALDAGTASLDTTDFQYPLPVQLNLHEEEVHGLL